MSERPSKWASWLPGNVSSRQELVRSETHGLNTEPKVPTDGMRQPAAPGTGLGMLILQDGKDQSVLLRLQGIWSGKIMRLIVTGMQVL